MQQAAVFREEAKIPLYTQLLNIKRQKKQTSWWTQFGVRRLKARYFSWELMETKLQLKSTLRYLCETCNYASIYYFITFIKFFTCFSKWLNYFKLKCCISVCFTIVFNVERLLSKKRKEQIKRQKKEVQLKSLRQSDQTYCLPSCRETGGEWNGEKWKRKRGQKWGEKE